MFFLSDYRHSGSRLCLRDWDTGNQFLEFCSNIQLPLHPDLHFSFATSVRLAVSIDPDDFPSQGRAPCLTFVGVLVNSLSLIIVTGMVFSASSVFLNDLDTERYQTAQPAFMVIHIFRFPDHTAKPTCMSIQLDKFS